MPITQERIDKAVEEAKQNPDITHVLVVKAIRKIDEALDKKISEWLLEDNSLIEKYYKGYICALNDVKWYLQNIENKAASIA